VALFLSDVVVELDPRVAFAAASFPPHLKQRLLGDNALAFLGLPSRRIGAKAHSPSSHRHDPFDRVVGTDLPGRQVGRAREVSPSQSSMDAIGQQPDPAG
jgi:hypothetical protein